MRHISQDFSSAAPAEWQQPRLRPCAKIYQDFNINMRLSSSAKKRTGSVQIVYYQTGSRHTLNAQ